MQKTVWKLVKGKWVKIQRFWVSFKNGRNIFLSRFKSLETNCRKRQTSVSDCHFQIANSKRIHTVIAPKIMSPESFIIFVKKCWIEQSVFLITNLVILLTFQEFMHSVSVFSTIEIFLWKVSFDHFRYSKPIFLSPIAIWYDCYFFRLTDYYICKNVHFNELILGFSEFNQAGLNKLVWLYS